MTDMDIQTYLDYHTTNELLNDIHAAEILKMFNTLPTYEYNDVFNNILTNTSRARILNEANAITETIQLLQKFTWNDDNNDYKIQVFENNDNKHIHILNCLKEVYFHNSFRKYIVDHNIEHTIVPEIVRYGIIHLPDTNKILSFIEIKRYIDKNSLFIEPDRIKQIRIIEDVLVKYKQTLLLVKQIETDLNMKFNYRCEKSCDVQCYEPNIEEDYHNDIINQMSYFVDTKPDIEEYEALYLSWKQKVEIVILHITSTDVSSDYPSNKHETISPSIDECRNIVYYNGKFVIPDFELSGCSVKTITAGDLFGVIV